MLHKYTINGYQIEAYLDSGAFWVVKSDMTTQEFDRRKWTLKQSVAFVVEMLETLETI